MGQALKLFYTTIHMSVLMASHS